MRGATLFLAGAVAIAAIGATPPARAQCPATLPAQGAAIRGVAPLFPADNPWNLDISAAPVDPASAAFIAFINNGGTRRLHPDFGGEVSPGSTGIYGFPYVVVDGATPKAAVTFQYWDESDGVDYATRAGVPFYPIPAQARTTAHWIEGGAPGNVDQRKQGDRHLLVVDCVNRHLYELYNVWFDPNALRWHAGSGAFFDLDSNARRPDGWTSADAAGLAILPGLVRYDEAWDPAVADLGHALRVTVRATNGYVFPASHRAGSTAGALPMGARLRLKSSVAGADPALRTANPNLRKVFRAMQKYGLIVADNGSDLFVSGTFDARWDNDILNPAFAQLTAADFDVIALGWNPAPAALPALAALALDRAQGAGGASFTATVTLTAPAPAGGAIVQIATSHPLLAPVPPTVSVPAGATAQSFTVTTAATRRNSPATITASFNGDTRSATLYVTRSDMVIDPGRQRLPVKQAPTAD